jgi:hypothetical protein
MIETTGEKMHRLFNEALHDPQVTPSNLIIEAMRRAYLAGRADANTDAEAA